MWGNLLRLEEGKEGSGCASPLAWRFGKQSWVSRHQGLALVPTGISGHVQAGGCGGPLHLGLTISLRPALPEGLVPSLSLWSHTPWECSPLASNASRVGTAESAGYRAWAQSCSSRFSDQRESCSRLPSTAISPRNSTETTASEAR